MRRFWLTFWALVALVWLASVSMLSAVVLDMVWATEKHPWTPPVLLLAVVSSLMLGSYVRKLECAVKAIKHFPCMCESCEAERKDLWVDAVLDQQMVPTDGPGKDALFVQEVRA